jgi:hypothetical protein
MDEFEEVIAAIASLAAIPDLPISAFRLAQEDNGPRTRVVFAPTDFETRAPIETGPRLAPDGTMYEAILRESWNVECLIWGETWALAEAVRRRLMVVIKQLFKTSVRFTGGSWVTQAAPEARHMYGGAELIRMRMTWDLDMYASPMVQVPVEHVQTLSVTAVVQDAPTGTTFTQDAPPAP